MVHGTRYEMQEDVPEGEAWRMGVAQLGCGCASVFLFCSCPVLYLS